ncbi:hypothetical protein O9K51_07303 [Purpureocillium lavendulum]|uniref:UDP-N-acetylglucosamine transferase subunit ALG14 n=1 Tax=Purpureocillium lavendulum TaxID=1247861 RepID=A0AB34FJT0_9HYPO|nr:hypothetical protein O9K51_07303 [Purpureocillium lavendulum]
MASVVDDETVLEDREDTTTIVAQGRADEKEEKEVRGSTDLTARRPGRLSFACPDPSPQFTAAAAAAAARPSTALSVRDFDYRRLLGDGNSMRRRLSTRIAGMFGRKRKARNADADDAATVAAAAAPAPGVVVTVTLPDPILLKFLFVGGKGVGQTSLLVSGTPDLNTVEMARAHSFDAVFLCFDVQDRLSMRNIVAWWTHARTRAFTKDCPFQMGFDPLLHLVGLKKDLRTKVPAGRSEVCFVDPHDAQVAAASIGAHRYVECSSKTHEGLDALFDEAGGEATRRPSSPPNYKSAIQTRSAVMGREALALSGLFAIAAVGAALLWRLVRALDRTTLLTAAALLIALAIVTTILRRRRATQWPKPPFGRESTAAGPRDATAVPLNGGGSGSGSDYGADEDGEDEGGRHGARGEYLLFVLGSGGHTKEMLMMMDDGSCDFSGAHRRYLVSSGDAMSAHHLREYEARLTELCRARRTSPGTFDMRTVTRARRVHQPLWTAPASALRSVADVVPALLSPPEARARRHRVPTRVFSNGPATGFVVALVVHLLKMAGLVPPDAMRFVYVESWARVSTLSLTGKLLYYTGLADAFYVQHEGVAAAYGLVNAGQMVFNARRPDVPET